MKLERYFEDPATLHVGTEENRAYYIPFAAKEDTDKPYEDSSRVILLSGDDWKFRHFPSYDHVEDDFFTQSFSSGHYDVIRVPSCWQILGYERNMYTNVRYPFPFDPPYVPDENSCGAYIKKFTVTDEQLAYQAYLNFEGVDSCYYVWVNGAFVGYSQVSHSTSEFHITPMLQEGENTLAVLVLKWCDGSYLEDQDKLRMSGIFRDTYILLRPKKHIRDFTVKTPVAESCRSAEIIIDFSYQEQPDDIRVSLYTPDGNFLESTVVSDNTVSFSLSEPILWNAEQPQQYQVVIETDDEKIVQKIGVRQVEIKDAVIYLNGQIIKFKGVNRHDSDPYTGYTISREQLVKDLRLMKEHNINAIRTSHYPNAPWATALYSEFGFYVIDEADLEIHGTTSIYGGGSEGDYLCPISKDITYGMLCHDPRFETAILDRTQRNVIRDKNCAGVLIWSLGNESGYGPNLEKAAAWAKGYDPSRLIHYEGSYCQMPGYQNDLSNIDVHSRMYAPVDAADVYFSDEFKKQLDKPFIQCEFVHAMGNGPGDIEDYFEKIYEYDGYAGGFVWEWCDHSVWMGKTNEGREKFFYGGDFGEFPHDGNFCMDGLVYPDRTPHTGLVELKNVIRPARASLKQVDEGSGVVVSLSNKLDFLDLTDELTVSYELFLDGRIMDSGAVAMPAGVKPHTSVDVTIPLRIPSSGECSIRLVYRQKRQKPLTPEGFELGFDQLMIREQIPEVPSPKAGAALLSTELERDIIISGGNFRYVFDKRTAAFREMVRGQVTLIERPVEYNIWRAPTDNDRNIRGDWERAGYDRHTVKVYACTVQAGENSLEITADFSISAIFIQRIITAKAVWTIHADGSINVRIDGQRDTTMPFLPRFGLRFFLPERYDSVDYYGYGPYESYIDKRRASYLGRFRSSVEDLHEDYIMPQENGSHYGCRTVELSDSHENKITVYGKGFSFQASHYSQEELSEKNHNFELEKSGHTVLCLDSHMSGIGSASCGPMLAEKYQVNGGKLTLELTIRF